jgi:hypothetical protein
MLEVSRLGISRRAVAALAASFGLCAMLALAVPGAAAAGDNEIADALRAGGLVMVVRHGAISFSWRHPCI